jgi:MFS family permease
MPTLVQFAALSSPGYRRFWLGSLASVGGTQLLFLGQGWLVFELSGSPFDLGLLGAAASVPSIIMTLFGGVLADRIDKRKLLMATSLVVAVLLLLLTVLDATGIVTVWQVLVVAALISCVSGLDWPARQAFFPSLIDRQQMMSAVALNSMLWQGSRMILPAIGGLIIAITDTAVVFAAAAAGFFCMFLVLASLNVGHTAPAQGASRAHFMEGVRFIATNQLFAGLIALTFVGMFFGTSFMQLMPAFADLLGTDERGFGALVSISGVGSISGTLIAGGFQHARRLGLIMLGGILLSSSSLYGFGLVTGFAESIPAAFYAALLFIFLMSLFSSIYLITSMTTLQLRVPNALRGRVMGIHGIAFSLISLGGLFGGTVASATSLPLAVVIGASVVLLAAVFVGVTQVEIRRLDGRVSESGHLSLEGRRVPGTAADVHEPK